MKGKLPYPLLTYLFEILCKDSYYEELQGDLIESYQQNVRHLGEHKAKRLYLKDLMSMVRPSVVKKLLFKNLTPSTSMITNYLKVAFRNFSRERLYTALNVTGLAIGISACLILLQYVNYESSYDAFHEDKEDVFRLAIDQVNPTSGAIEFQNAQVFYAVHSSITKEIPEIEHSTQLFAGQGVFDTSSELFREDKVFFTGSTFFDVFSFPLIKGNKIDLDNINTIFLSESLAAKFFGQEDPIGKKVIFNSGLRNPFDLEVRGIFKDFPKHSHIQTNALISMVSFEGQIDANLFFGPQLRLEDVKWRWMQFYTYIKAFPHTDREALASKITDFIHAHRKPFDEAQGRINNLILQPIETIHLDSNRSGELQTPGSRKLNQFLFVIALLIVVIAWINYVNLATARAVNRGKEVGVRKVIGARPSQLRNQFLLESLILNGMAIVIAIVICLLAAPYFESLLGKNLFSDSLNFQGIVNFFFLIAFGSLLAGMYPAWILSAYQPISILKGKFSKSKSGVAIRKGLVIFQFTIAVFLLTGIYAVSSQLGFMINHETGLTISQTVIIQRPPLPFNESAAQQKIENFRIQLNELADVSNVTVASYMPGPENAWKQTCFMRGVSDKSVLLSRVAIDTNYLSFFGIQLAEGKAYHNELRGASRGVIVNEKLVSDFGFDSNRDILGKSIEFPGGQNAEVIGVTKDFYNRGLRFPVEPMVMHLDSVNTGQFIAIKTTKKSASELGSIKELFQSSFANSLFEYSLLEETFDKIYAEDARFKSIITLFTGIAIIIACLGLLGLSSYLLSQRLKEISIRKVLGAKLLQLFGLLVKEYVVLTLAGVLISIPFGYYAINNWLATYATRIEITPMMFIVPLLILIPLVILTICYQTIKATLVNPVDCLKNE